jgi:hypothetical protein
MQKKLLCYGVLFLALGLGLSSMTGCGSTSTTPSAGNVPVVVTMGDTPPTGVTVLDSSIVVTGLTLVGQGVSNDSLITSNKTVELSNLLTSTDLLADTNAVAGTYSGLTITFATPTLTIQNSSTAALSVNGTTCNIGAICTVSPTLNSASVSITSSPFPLTLSANTPITLALDFNMNSSIQSNMTISPTVTVTTPAASNGNLQNLAVTGQVTTASSSGFTVQDTNTGQPVQLSNGTGTTFSGFTTANGATCATANTAACVASNQNVLVNYGISSTSPGTLTPTSVTLLPGITNGIVGTVISKNTGANTFTMVTTGASPSETGTTVGQQLVVTLASNATFSTEATSLTVPVGDTFTALASILPGQTVEINATSFSSTAGTATANAVMLLPSQFTGTVTGVSGTNVTLNGLNGVFTGGGTNSLTVGTSAGTTYGGTLTGFSGITTGQTVTVGGAVYPTTTGVSVVGGQISH